VSKRPALSVKQRLSTATLKGIRHLNAYLVSLLIPLNLGAKDPPQPILDLLPIYSHRYRTYRTTIASQTYTGGQGSGRIAYQIVKGRISVPFLRQRELIRYKNTLLSRETNRKVLINDETSALVIEITRKS
jgi:hypothetical protein